jgi:hypothetical protein
MPGTRLSESSGIYDNFLASNCQDRRPAASNFGLKGWDQFIRWDHLGIKNPCFMGLFSGVSGVRTIESS